MSIKWLKDITQEDTPVVGGKAAGLGELMGEGFSVPNGFVVTNLNDVGQTIEDAYHDLGIRVAVRSSSVAEDGDKHSFAGQYDTYLNKIGIKDVEQAVLDCFASINNPRAVEYREMCGVKDDKMSVLVQSMVDPRAAGVMFTRDPVTGSEDNVCIEVVEGLGNELVAGKVIPEDYLVNKQFLRPTPEPDGDSILSFADTEFLAIEAMEIEAYFNAPQDIEFCIDYDDTIWICQSRPVVI